MVVFTDQLICYNLPKVLRCFPKGWFKKKLSLFILSGRAEEGQRERGRERIPGRLCAVSAEPNAGLELMNCEIMTWAETKSQMLNRLSHPGTPRIIFNRSMKMVLGTGWNVSVHLIHETVVISIRTNPRPLFVWHTVFSFHIPCPQKLMCVCISCKAACIDIYPVLDTKLSCPLPRVQSQQAIPALPARLQVLRKQIKGPTLSLPEME